MVGTSMRSSNTQVTTIVDQNEFEKQQTTEVTELSKQILTLASSSHHGPQDGTRQKKKHRTKSTAHSRKTRRTAQPANKEDVVAAKQSMHQRASGNSDTSPSRLNSNNAGSLRSQSNETPNAEVEQEQEAFETEPQGGLEQETTTSAEEHQGTTDSALITATIAESDEQVEERVRQQILSQAVQAEVLVVHRVESSGTVCETTDVEKGRVKDKDGSSVLHSSSKDKTKITETAQKNRFRLMSLLLLVALGVVGGVLVGVVLGLDRGSNDEDNNNNTLSASRPPPPSDTRKGDEGKPKSNDDRGDGGKPKSNDDRDDRKPPKQQPRQQPPPPPPPN